MQNPEVIYQEHMTFKFTSGEPDVKSGSWLSALFHTVLNHFLRFPKASGNYCQFCHGDICF